MAAPQPRRAQGEAPGTTEIPIRGMHCAGCASTVEKALADVAGVEAASVNFATARATVRGPAALSALVSGVRAAGYDVGTRTTTLLGARPAAAERLRGVDGV